MSGVFKFVLIRTCPVNSFCHFFSINITLKLNQHKIDLLKKFIFFEIGERDAFKIGLKGLRTSKLSFSRTGWTTWLDILSRVFNLQKTLFSFLLMFDRTKSVWNYTPCSESTRNLPSPLRSNIWRMETNFLATFTVMSTVASIIQALTVLRFHPHRVNYTCLVFAYKPIKSQHAASRIGPNRASIFHEFHPLGMALKAVARSLLMVRMSSSSVFSLFCTFPPRMKMSPKPFWDVSLG